MPSPPIHAIVTVYPEYGLSLTSPQIPGMFYDLVAPVSMQDLAEILQEAGAPTEFQIYRHTQVYQSREGRVWMVRCMDEPRGAREATRRTLESLLDATPRPIDQAKVADTGEATFVVALPTDTVRWLGDQLFPGDSVTVAMLEGEGLALLNASHAGDGAARVDPDWTLEQLFASLTEIVRMAVEFSVHRTDAEAGLQTALDEQARGNYALV